MATRKRRRTVSKSEIMLGAVAPSTAVAYGTQRTQELPTTTNQIFTRLRTLSTDSEFLSTYQFAKTSIWDYGFAVTRGPGSKAKEEAVKEWLAKEITTEAEYEDPSTREKLTIELHTTVEEAIRKFKDDVWAEFLLLDNVVGMWLDNSPFPITLNPEACRYTDTLGIPVLFYTHGLSAEQIKLLPKDSQQRFSQKSEIMLNPDEGEHFKVLKRGLAGSGFVKPTLFAVLETLGEVASKQVGYHALAYLTRGAVRQHKLGHEISQGPHAGKPTYHWNMKRHNAVMNQFNGRQGPQEFTSNFDHEILYPWPDPKIFDETAWKGTNMRLRNWGGPVGQLLIGDKVIEGGFNLMRCQATRDRQLMADFLRPIIKAVFNPPEDADIRVTWSDMPFIDPKLVGELIKFSVQQGLSSVTTARKWIGLRSEEEDANKLVEAADGELQKKYLPLFDMSHGITPATGMLNDPAKAAAVGGADKKNGRPAGGGTPGAGSD